MQTSLQGRAKKAQSQKQYRFRDRYGLLNEELLKECWRDIRRDAAYGVDRVSAQDYEQPLDENIRDLVERLKGSGTGPNSCDGTTFRKAMDASVP